MKFSTNLCIWWKLKSVSLSFQKRVILKNIYILCFLLKMVLILSLSILDIICDFVLVRKSFKTKKIKKLV